MRVPLSWLREFVEVPEGATPDDVYASLVAVGFEEEDAIGFDVTGPVVVGRVESFDAEPQKNGKVIRWCQVDVGEAHGGVRGSSAALRTSSRATRSWRRFRERCSRARSRSPRGRRTDTPPTA